MQNILEKYKDRAKNYYKELKKNKGLDIYWQSGYYITIISTKYKEEIKLHNELCELINKSTDIKKLKEARIRWINKLEIIDGMIRFKHDLWTINLIQVIDKRIIELSNNK